MNQNNIPYYGGYQGQDRQNNNGASIDNSQGGGGGPRGIQAPPPLPFPPPHAPPGSMGPPMFPPPSLQQIHHSVGSKNVDAFNRLYALQEEIGRGAFSVVHRCQNRVTGEDFAVKIIDLRPLQLREKFDQTRLRREVEIMQKLNHPHIIRLEGVFENAQTLMLVLEYARGTELFDSILQKKKYNEPEARAIFEQVAHALAYLHSMNVVHRDVKPENVILLDKISPENYFPFAKLLDFGLSKMIGQDDGSAARTFVGTPCYLAPEVEARAYGRGNTYGTKVDCWSLGAVLYVMLVARFPEFDRSHGGMTVKMDSPTWAAVSESAKDLIKHLMNVDPLGRFSVNQALRHPWVTSMPFRPTPTTGLMHGMRGPAVGSGLIAGPSPEIVRGAGQHPGGYGAYDPTGSGGHAFSPAMRGLSDVSSGSGDSHPGGLPVGDHRHPRMEIYKLTLSGEQVGIFSTSSASSGTASSSSSDLGVEGSHHYHHQGGPGGAAYPLLANFYSIPIRTNVHMEPGTTGVRASMPGGPNPLYNPNAPPTASAGGSIPPGSPFIGPPPPQTKQQQQIQQTMDRESMRLLPLVHIQHTIANSIDLAHRACAASPEDANDIKRSAILCRSQLIHTIKLLKKIEQTAASVLEMFPDLELAVEDGEPILAHEFFNTVKRWVGDLRHTVAEAQHRNQESMFKLHKILLRGGEGKLDDMEDPRSNAHCYVTNGQSGPPSATSSTLSVSSSGHATGTHEGQSIGRNSSSASDMDVGGETLQQAKAGSSSSGLRNSRVRSRDEIEDDPVQELERRRSLLATMSDKAARGGGRGESGPFARDNSSASAESQKEAGLMSLDPELYHVVKKLKEAKDNDVQLSENQLLDLFFSVNSNQNGPLAEHTASRQSVDSFNVYEGGLAPSDSLSSPPSLGGHPATNGLSSMSTIPGGQGGGAAAPASGGGALEGKALSMEQILDEQQEPAVASGSSSSASSTAQQAAATATAGTSARDAPFAGGAEGSSSSNSLQMTLDELIENSGAEAAKSSASRSKELNVVLGKLKDVDHILEHLAIFWAQTEVVLDVLLQKSDHVERFVEFAHKPRLLSRFQQRMSEYRAFWAGIQAMCNHYTTAVGQASNAMQQQPVPPSTHNGRYYQFLETP